MKILQILPSLNVGGVERGVIDLARALKERGEESVVISSGGDLVQELQKIGVPHYSLPVHQKSIFALALVSKIAEVIQKERIDVVHARSRVPAWIAWLAARRTGVPFITTCHGYYSTHPLSQVMGWGKRVIVISRIIGRHMIDDFHVSPDRIRLIHRGMDLSQFSFSAKRYENTKPHVMRVVNIGRLSPIKGQLEFLRAIHLVHREFPQIEVWLVGSEEKGKQKYTTLLQRTIQQLRLESCVKLVGTRRDIPEILSGSDLLVLSTLVPEAFGRVVIEAGASGVAVVSTRVGGVLDIIDHGENGLLVPPGDIPAMAKAIVEMLKDREKAKTFAVRLREKIEKQFTLDQMAEQTLTVYREVRKDRKILVIKLGAMGDVILGIPSLRMLRERFPDATIHMMVDKKLASFVSTAPYLNEVLPVDRKKFSNFFSLLKIAKRVRREGYDISVDLQNSKWTHLVAFLAGIPARYGFERGKLGFLLTRPDRTFEVADSPVKHQFRVLSKLGIKKLDERLELWPDPEASRKVDRLLTDLSVDPLEKLVGFVIGSSPSWPTKRWPLPYFEELSTRLVKKHGCKVVLIGSEEDHFLAEEFVSHSSGGVVNLVGKTLPADLVPLIKRLKVLVTGDTAPLHVASAVKTKIVALFGPTDPKRHMPTGNGSVVLSRHLPCQPCYQGSCQNSEKLACLTQISVDEVFQAVQKQLTL